jgi:hypothetical protein
MKRTSPQGTLARGEKDGVTGLTGLISEPERTAALAVVDELGPKITGYDPLFDDIGWDRLAAATRLSLPPLRNLP